MLEILEKGQGKPSLQRQNSAPTSTPATPVNNNNNPSKLATTAATNSVTAAILNTTAIKQELEQPTVTANVNVIEIKNTNGTVKLEPKMEIDVKDVNNILFNSDDLNALDNSLALDPALSDLALQVCNVSS